MDQVVLPLPHGRPGAAETVRSGMQSGRLPLLIGIASHSRALVAHHAAGEANQDQGKGRQACSVRNIRDGGSGRAQQAVP